MNHSESIANLAAALVKVQAKLEPVKREHTAKIESRKGSGSSFSYSYASLDDVMASCRDLLAENGLAVTQLPVTAEGGVGLETVLLHQSGEYIAETFRMPCEGGAQAVGSALSYARRYAFLAVVGIPMEDDDGAAATTSQKDTQTSPTASAAPKTGTDTPEEDRGSCPVHGVPFVHRVGERKDTGKPFDFWACPEKNEDGSWCDQKPPRRSKEDQLAQAASAPAEDDDDPWAEEGEKPERTATGWKQFLKTELKARGIKKDERRQLITQWARDKALAHVPKDEDWNAALYKAFWQWLLETEKSG